MSRNLGLEDRLFRLILAVSLFSLALVLEGQGRLIGLFGVLPFAGVVTGWSPLYALFRIHTDTATAGEPRHGRAARRLAARSGSP